MSEQDLSRLRKHSVLVAGHQTSLSVEDAFWRELQSIAQARGQSVNNLITEIDAARTGNLSAAVRVFVLQTLQEKPR